MPSFGVATGAIPLEGDATDASAAFASEAKLYPLRAATSRKAFLADFIALDIAAFACQPLHTVKSPAKPTKSGSLEALTTLIFNQQGSATKLTMRIDCASVEERDALLQMRIDAGRVHTCTGVVCGRHSHIP